MRHHIALLTVSLAAAAAACTPGSRSDGHAYDEARSKRRGSRSESAEAPCPMGYNMPVATPDTTRYSMPNADAGTTGDSAMVVTLPCSDTVKEG